MSGKNWLEVGGWVAFGVVAGVLLRGMFDEEARRASRRPAAVAAVRG